MRGWRLGRRLDCPRVRALRALIWPAFPLGKVVVKIIGVGPSPRALHFWSTLTLAFSASATCLSLSNGRRAGGVIGVDSLLAVS